MASDNKVFAKTLAIIDLEATGLPSFECNRTKITQLCVIACSIEHINNLNSKDVIPRVLHKLSLCFNPSKLIKLDVEEITGLSNELLEHERKFDENAADLISNFLCRLQQPVLLVAHNGNRYDYPILKKHLNAVNKSLPVSIKCCDSFEIFRKIDERYEKNSKVLINGQKLTSWEKLDDEMVSFIDKEIFEIEFLLENYQSDEEVAKLENEYFKLAPEKEKDENFDEFKARQKLNETTPQRPSKPENKVPLSKEKGEENGGKNKRPVKRELFPNDPSTSTNGKNGSKWPKGKYKLIEIYRRLFDEYPENSHDAEADVTHLLKCVIAQKKEFLELAQSMSINFCDVKEL